MKIKEFLQKIWSAIRKAFYKVDDETKKLVPIAIRIVEGLKYAMDTPVDDIVLSIVKAAIPGQADDIAINKIKAIVERYLPIVLANLYMIDTIAKIEDPNEKLKAVLAQFKFSSDELKSLAYQDLCKLSLTALADGKLTLGEAAVIGEWYYQNIYKK